MNSLLRCIQIALLAAFWPSLTLASPGSGRDSDRDREYADDDSSGRGSGRDDSDDRYDTVGDDRDDDDRDNTESSLSDAEYDAVYYEDREDDRHSNSESGGDYDDSETYNSASGSADYGSDSSGSGSGDYGSDNSGSGSGDYGSDNSGSGSGDYGSDNSGSGSGDYGSDNSGSGSGDYGSDNSGSGSDDDDDDGHSGSGGHDDDDVDDHSGSGGHDDDDDHSGSGSSGGYEDDSSNSGSGSGGHDYTDNNSNSGPGSGTPASENNTLEIALSVDHHIEAPLEVSRDAEGREYVRDEALMLCLPSDVAVAIAQGFELISERRLASDGRVVARLLTPSGMDIDEAVAVLRAAAPSAVVSRNTVFRSAQASSLVAATPSRRAQAPIRGLLGIVDTGADTNFLGRGAVVATRAFAAPAYTSREHGSVVASIAAASGVRVQIADVFSVASDGEIAASADAIVAALDWMIGTGVPVINVSIEGPENPLLTAIVHTATARGHIIVAAAGNGGPMGRPVFPAALEGAVAVTAVDNTGHAYRRANRGDYISFAARGVDLEVNLGADVVTVSGTSFAAPFVAARLATQYHAASPAQARAVLDVMRASAVDLGRPGRDPVFGWGLVSD